MKVYTLYVWDRLLGGWYIADEGDNVSNIQSGDVFATIEDPAVWKIVLTEVVAKSDTQPIGE